MEKPYNSQANEDVYTDGILPIYRVKATIICVFICIAIDIGIAAMWIPISLSETGQVYSFWLLFTIIAILIIPTTLTYIWGYFYARNFQYTVDKKFIRIKYGVIARNRTTIPFSRIQNIAIKQSLIDRILNIYTVAIETAGGSGAAQKGGSIRPEGFIPGLKDPTKLESIIDKLIHEYTQDVPDGVRNKLFLDKDMAFDEFIAYVLMKMTEVDDMKTQIRELRKKQGWTQGELAEKTGVSRQTINYLENGKYVPSLKLALKIAKLFQVPIEAIFELEADEM